MEEINGIKVPFIPVGGVDGQHNNNLSTIPQNGIFEEILKKELDGIKFSHHAKTRLESRNIRLSDTQMSLLQDAVNRAEQKGSKDSLVVMNNIAFIVNVKNKTVVTAIDGENMNENVFTNIDSAVLINNQ
ncbi:MAG: TIGR02530 family flagellar biosynthesis protein [Candidatus Kryptoniota bacterium]